MDKWLRNRLEDNEDIVGGEIVKEDSGNGSVALQSPDLRETVQLPESEESNESAQEHNDNGIYQEWLNYWTRQVGHHPSLLLRSTIFRILRPDVTIINWFVA